MPQVEEKKKTGTIKFRPQEVINKERQEEREKKREELLLKVQRILEGKN